MGVSEPCAVFQKSIRMTVFCINTHIQSPFGKETLPLHTFLELPIITI